MARDPQGYTHLIKYPTLGSAELLSEPFASQYQFFRDVLAGTRLLVIIGSSLRDIAILDVIRQALDRNPDLHIGYLDPEKDHE